MECDVVSCVVSCFEIFRVVGKCVGVKKKVINLNEQMTNTIDYRESFTFLPKSRILPVAELLVLLVHDSTGLYGKVNLTKFFESQLRSDLPVLRDLSSYLSEEYGNDEEPEKPEDFRQLDRQNRNLIPEYRNLCETVTRRIQFNDENYEYQPPHYHEVYCKSYSFLDRASERTTRSSSKQKCAHPVFHCVQRSRTLFLVRRAWNSDCWEPFTKEIASGCDCMWPVSLLGDITAHY